MGTIDRRWRWYHWIVIVTAVAGLLILSASCAPRPIVDDPPAALIDGEKHWKAPATSEAKEQLRQVWAYVRHVVALIGAEEYDDAFSYCRQLVAMWGAALSGDCGQTDGSPTVAETNDTDEPWGVPAATPVDPDTQATLDHAAAAQEELTNAIERKQ